MKLFAKLSFLLLFSVVLSATINAQGKPKSPPASMSEVFGESEITINYNSPSVKGRTIYGNLVPYDKVWRTGANGSTKITLTKQVMIQGQRLAAGTYSIFTIPGEKEWTFIFNTVAEQWGAYDYDKSKDALRVTATPEVSKESVEAMRFVKQDFNIVFEWANLSVPLKVTPMK